MFKKLLKKIITCYGFAKNKVIPIVYRVNAEESISGKQPQILKTEFTHDGKTILRALSHEDCGNLGLYTLSKTVTQFEQEYGDSTTLLTLLACYLVEQGRKIKQEEISSLFSIMEDYKKGWNNNKKKWVKTVLRNDPKSEEIAEIVLNNRIASMSLMHSSDEKFIVDKRQGFELRTSIEPVYRLPCFKQMNDVNIILEHREITPSVFKELINDLETNDLCVVICRWYGAEVETMINSKNNCNMLFFRCPMMKGVIFDDIFHLIDHKEIISANKKYCIAKADVSVADDRIIISRFKEREGVNEYCKGLIRLASKKDSMEQLSTTNRINAISNTQIDHLTICSPDKSRRDDLKYMIEDILKSKKHAEKGLIRGYLSFVPEDIHSPLFESLLRCKEALNLNNKEQNSRFLKDAVDSEVTIKQAIEYAVAFSNNWLNVEDSESINIYNGGIL